MMMMVVVMVVALVVVSNFGVESLVGWVMMVVDDEVIKPDDVNIDG